MPAKVLNILNKRVPPLFAWGVIGVLTAIFMSLFLSFQAGVFLILFLLVAYFVWDNPEQSFLLLIIIAPVLPMLKITGTISTLTVIKDVIIIFLFAKVFLIPLFAKKLPYRRSILFLPIIALLFWTVFAAFRAEHMLLGMLRARDIILYILLYFIALYLPINKRILKERFIWFLLATLIVVILGIYQWFLAPDSAVMRFDPVRDVWIPRISSIMAHPSILGQYLVIAISIFTALCINTKKQSTQILLSFLIALLAVIVFLTYSRAAWFALTAALAVISVTVFYIKWLNGYLKQTSKAKITSFLLTVSLGGLLLLLPLIFFTPAGVLLKTTFDPTYGSNEERIEFMIRLVAPLSNTESIIGRGLGNVTAQQFRTINIEAYDIATGSAQAVQQAKNRTLVDNQYLKTFVEMGLFGLLIYAWLFWICMKHAFILAANKTHKIAQITGLAGLGIFTSFILQGFFIDIWEIWPTNALFWITAGLVSMYSWEKIPKNLEI